MAGSNDPILDAVVFLMVAMLVVALLIVGLTVGAVVAVPAGAAYVGYRLYRAHKNRPVPTSQLLSLEQERVRKADFPTHEEFLKAHLERLLESWGDELPPEPVYQAMAEVAGTLYAAENLSNPLPPLQSFSDAIEEARYRDWLIAHMRKLEDPNETLRLIQQTFADTFALFMRALPPFGRQTREEFFSDREPSTTVPAIDVLDNVPQTVHDISALYFADELRDRGLCAEMRHILDRNLHSMSGLEYPALPEKLVFAPKHKGTPREIVHGYLGSTPLEQLFLAEVKFEIPDRMRFEHTHIVAGSGHGKTQFLQHMIFNDLTRADPPSLIVIDSQGEMLRKIERLALFEPTAERSLADRILIVDAEDVEHPIALNMFAVPSERLSGYAPAIREQLEAGTIELFNYIFGALAAELTQKQGTAFAYVARLMLSIPGATIHTLRELMEDGAASVEQSQFAPYIRALDPTSRAFFEHQFFNRSAFGQTKQQIARRLYGVLQVPAFDRMFSSKVNKLDLFTAMQAGTIVLVNTSKALLKSDASALFGRYMIALALNAAFERVAIPEDQRRPAFLILDEAAEYFDENLETLLSQARKFKLGVIFAHQHLDQLTPALRSSVAANTSIKFAGGVSDRDARTLAPDMRTTPDFIAGMAKHAHSTDFACYVRNYTANAVRLTIPFGTLEAAPRMSRDAHAELVAANRRRYAAERETPRPATASLDTETVDGENWRS